NKYASGKVIVKGLSYKLKISGSSFRMHMRNRRFTNTPKINIHELNRTSCSRPVYATSLPIAIGSPEKGLCRSDYRCRVHIIEILKKMSMVAESRGYFSAMLLQ